MLNVECRIFNFQLSIFNCQLDVNWTQKRNKAFTLVVVAVAKSSKGI